MLLSNGGFKYLKNVCGINTWEIELGGLGYVEDEILNVTGGGGRYALVKVKSVRSEVIVGVGTVEGIIDEIEIVDAGENYTTEDFGQLDDEGGYDYRTSKVKVSGGSGDGAIIYFTGGIIYQTVGQDEGPELRSDTHVALTDDNNDGNGNDISGTVKGLKQTVIQMSNPNKTGQYDLFFHFHNDIAHTVTDGKGQMGLGAQYVTMELVAN